jgi:FdhD protein
VVEENLENRLEEFDIIQFSKTGYIDTKISIARELPVTIILNNKELVTLLSSPSELDYLAIGYLYSEGFINSRSSIQEVLIDDIRGIVRVNTSEIVQIDQDITFKRLITSGCGRGISFYSAADIYNQKVTSQAKISAQEIFELVLTFQRKSELYLSTHGVHSAALCDNQKILVIGEDIGRHNAIDRIFGKCLLNDIPINDRMIITSGRVSSEILHKIAKRNIPIIASISAPTNLSVKIADSLGITLVCRVSGRHRMNIHTNDWRIIR